MHVNNESLLIRDEFFIHYLLLLDNLAKHFSKLLTNKLWNIKLKLSRKVFYTFSITSLDLHQN